MAESRAFVDLRLQLTVALPHTAACWGFAGGVLGGGWRKYGVQRHTFFLFFFIFFVVVITVFFLFCSRKNGFLLI
jgi:hypothetical protein